MAFIPHMSADVSAMLRTIGVASIDELFDEIPPELAAAELHDVPEPLNEMQIGRLMRERARTDGAPLVFVGAGAYEHHIPAAVWALAARGEFYTSYTPYQAEASQGTLQVIYEFQTMIASLTGLEVANASLYDGASALAEAALMAVRANRRSTSKRLLVPTTVHPHYRGVLETIAAPQGLTFDPLPYAANGGIDAAALARGETADCAAIVLQQPNFFGALEDVDAITDWAHAKGMLVIAVVNPVSLALLKPPGAWGTEGADIVVGEGQPLGVPLASGGPYFGFMATRRSYVRSMPGRIVGRTLDRVGRVGYTLTLQAREQHIRRAKATSNICTNQGLLVTAATIHLSLLGAEGLARTAAACHARTRALIERLCRLPGVGRRFAGPYFHEVVLSFDRPVAPLLERLARAGIVGGYDLSRHYPELGHALLVCATETKTEADLERYQQALAQALQDAPSARRQP
ncbi:MAG: aminomethyl-transferring glycine dehydrogenase subunit GcvPA [Gammaproteobacteria bacterium]|nr:aminomethyl-transferring glycine dehydrogenase subunit GcvPA [Gammaproteobacteria bacterium]